MIQPWPTGAWPPTPERDTAILVGSGPGALDDLQDAIKLRPGADFWAVNHMALLWPNFRAVITLHWEAALTWREMHREINGRDIPFEAGPPTVSGVQPQQVAGVDRWWINGLTSASSGPFALQVLRWGHKYREVIACGMPLEQSGTCIPAEMHGDFCRRQALRSKDNYFEKTGWSTGHHGAPIRAYRASFKKRVDEGMFVGCYAMSGYTRELLGAPPQ